MSNRLLSLANNHSKSVWYYYYVFHSIHAHVQFNRSLEYDVIGISLYPALFFLKCTTSFSTWSLHPRLNERQLRTKKRGQMKFVYEYFAINFFHSSKRQNCFCSNECFWRQCRCNTEVLIRFGLPRKKRLSVGQFPSCVLNVTTSHFRKIGLLSSFQSTPVLKSVLLPDYIIVRLGRQKWIYQGEKRRRGNAEIR